MSIRSNTVPCPARQTAATEMALFSRKTKLLETQRAAEEMAEFDRLGSRALVGVTPIADTVWRSNVRVAGRVKGVRVQPWACLLYTSPSPRD